MAIPAGITPITVTGKYLAPDGTALSGYLLFTPSIKAADSTDNAIVPVAPYKVTLDANGAFSVALMATDDPQWNDPGWTYEVQEVITTTQGVRKKSTYNIEVPAASAGGTLDMADAVVVDLPGTPSQYLLKAGGTMTGNIITASGVNITMANNGQVQIGDVTMKRDATDMLGVDSSITVEQVASAPDISTLPLGPTAKAKSTGINIVSSYAGGEDNSGGEDSTGRINLYSYQRAASHSFGEVVRMYAMRQDSKQMLAWYGAQKTGTQEDGYDNTTREVLGSGVSWKPWAWLGAHYEANDHASVHGHISLEVPDSTGALQTRLEVLFADRDTGLIGLDKTYIITNDADFVVRCGSGEVLRLSGGAGTAKTIEFNHDSFGETTGKRWDVRVTNEAESTNSAGSNFEIVRRNDNGVAQDAPIRIVRAGNGDVLIGGNGSATLIAQGRATIGTSTAQSNKLHVTDGTATNQVALIKATAIGTASVAVLAVENSDSSKRLLDLRTTGADVSLLRVSGSGTIELGNGTVVDTNLYRSAANVLKTDDKFIAALGIGVGNSASATAVGTLSRKMEVFDASGASLGFVPIYTIT
jgi:hypothetical protein